jgi:hypothetical protein
MDQPSQIVSVGIDPLHGFSQSVRVGFGFGVEGFVELILM